MELRVGICILALIGIGFILNNIVKDVSDIK